MNKITNSSLSSALHEWLHSDSPKTVGGLIDAFDERGFAMLFLLLMFPSALPLPTGGITHIFQFIVVIVALETLIGRHTVWLPGWLRKKPLGDALAKKALPKMTHWLLKMERFTKPRLSRLLANRVARGVFGSIVFVFTIFAAFAPPFSGLDTLPSLGVVVMSLAMFFEDIVVFIVGLIVGTIGCLINLAAISAFFAWISHLIS